MKPILHFFSEKNHQNSFWVYHVYVIQLAGAHLIEGHVKMMLDQIKHVMTASVARKKEKAERAKEEDFDDEEGEMLKEENEQEEEVFDRV